MAAFLEPSDKGARKTIESKMHADDKVYMRQGEFFFLDTLGGFFCAETWKRMLQKARESARTKVLCFDGSMKGVLNVLYQVPHGGRRDDTPETEGACHVIGSLLCPDGPIDCKCGRT